MNHFQERLNQLDQELEKEVRNKTSKELQTLLSNPDVLSSMKEAIKAELDIRLSKGISDLNSTMTRVDSSIGLLTKKIEKLDKSTTKYNRILIGLTVGIAVLTLITVVRMFIR